MTEPNCFQTYPSWLLGDHLGSTSMVTDASGVMVSEARYSAFGETRYDSGTMTTDYLYTGQRQEAEVGLYYYVARWYDPAIGRFIQADSIVPNPGSALGFDRYAYTANNPMKYVDPSGHRFCDWDGAGCSDEGTGTGYGSDYDWLPSTWSYGGGGNGPDPYKREKKDNYSVIDFFAETYNIFSEWEDSQSIVDFDADPFDAVDPVSNVENNPIVEIVLPWVKFKETTEDLIGWIGEFMIKPEVDSQREYKTQKPTIMHNLLSTNMAITKSPTYSPSSTPTPTLTPTITPTPTLPEYLFWTLTPSETMTIQPINTPTSLWSQTGSP